MPLNNPISVDSIKAETDKIPAEVIKAATILDEVVEIAHHLHGRERWLGKSAASTEADAAADVLTPFIIDSGNNAYGTGVCILGTTDTPFINPANVKFDLHEILIVATERTAEPYKIRISWGDTEAAGIAAGNYSTLMLYPTTQIRTAPIFMMMPRLLVGTKVWANCWCANNTGTIQFFVGIHEYAQ